MEFGERNLRRLGCELIFVSLEDLCSLFFEDMMNNLMSKEFRGLNALKLRTVMKKERNGIQESL